MDKARIKAAENIIPESSQIGFASTNEELKNEAFCSVKGLLTKRTYKGALRKMLGQFTGK